MASKLLGELDSELYIESDFKALVTTIQKSTRSKAFAVADDRC